MFLLLLCWANYLFTTTWHSWLQNKKRHWGWLLQWPALVVIGCWGLPRTATCLLFCVFLGLCVFVYSMCMRATIVLYIYLCDCIGIFECEAHFNIIIVPASVWGYEVMEGFTCFTVRMFRGEFWERRKRWWWFSRCFRVHGQCAIPNAGQSPVWSEGEVLFDDLRTVAPGFGLSLGQSQPGWLCGHLRRVTGGEALWHLLDRRWRRCRVCNLNWNNKSRTKACYTH